jgi:peptidyl-tRNA hydrolase, PTH1 family
MTGTDVWLVVGLGNPGPSYAGNRHNVGYLVADELADRMGGRFRAHKSGRAEVLEGRLGTPGADTPRVVLVRSRTYMNETGGAVKQLAAFYKVPTERIVAVHDELDIAQGELRVKLGGGSAGHNGLRSLTQALRTPDYHRVRIGIGRPPGRQDPADFVLEPIGKKVEAEIAGWVDRAVEAVRLLIGAGLAATQDRFNRDAGRA